VSVPVERHGRGGVAEHRLDALDRRPGRDRQRCGGVPQLVGDQAGDTRSGRRAVEVTAAEVLHAQRRLVGRGEDEITRSAAGDLPGQLVPQKARDGHPRACDFGEPRIRRPLTSATALGNLDATTHEVQASHAERGDLTPAQAGTSSSMSGAGAGTFRRCRLSGCGQATYRRVVGRVTKRPIVPRVALCS
jgi:hypothetical protein